MNLSILREWLEQRAGGLYGGEAITQQAHALQCASLALHAQASEELVAAALLHDIGHLVPGAIDTSQPHGELAADLLSDLFGAAVTMPIRHHVAAKRYLCVADPHYWSSLSPASQRSLAWQGGVFTLEEAHEFIALPYAEDAVNLRLWDDAAKVVGAPTESMDFFLARLEKLSFSSKHSVQTYANRPYS